MRNTLLLLSATALIALSSCNHGLGRKGNGHVTTEDRKVSPFTKISIEGIFPVEITQTGGAESVKVETDDNLQDMISVKSNDGELSINSTDQSIYKSTKMKVYVNIKDIKELNIKSVGALTTPDVLKLDSVEVNSESVGKLNMSLNAQYLRANLESVGSTQLSGNVFEARINNKSVGSLSAFDLKANVMMIHNTSVGVTEVYADSAFYIRSSAIGALYYKGPGDVKELKNDGIGRVQKKD
jgi:hypothetical protein